ncbi:MAG: hypothetical protein ACI9TH_000723 [Kiritimatiellia bacterium]|jgi:uncharacterized protein (DUF58 family)
MRIKALELRAKVVVEGYLSGIHRSPFHGFSVEFTEYRDYSPGDDTRHLDWKLYARSDRLYIKRYEDETNLRCWFLVDQSASMAFTSLDYTKATYGATLAATLAQFLYSQGDAVGLMAFDQDITHYLPARNRPGHLRHLMLELEKEPEGLGTELERPLRKMADMLNKRGLVVLISDLLTSIDALQKQLGYLRSRGHEVIVFQILDPAERELDFKTPSVFKDLETGEDMLVDPQAARAEYQENLKAHLEQIGTICHGLGIDHHALGTDRPLELALQEFVLDRSQRRAMPMRRN